MKRTDFRPNNTSSSISIHDREVIRKSNKRLKEGRNKRFKTSKSAIKYAKTLNVAGGKIEIIKHTSKNKKTDFYTLNY